MFKKFYVARLHLFQTTCQANLFNLSTFLQNIVNSQKALYIFSLYIEYYITFISNKYERLKITN